MTGQKPKSPPSDGSIYVWAGTIFVALAIIGFCVFVALSHKPAVQPVTTPPPRQQPAPVQPVPEPEPARPTLQPQTHVVAPQPTPQPEPVAPTPEGPPRLLLDNLAGTLRLNVPFLQSGERIPLEYTCFRNNISPPMAWQGAPAGTQSFVVFLEKRTAGEDEAFVNWILFDIPASMTELAQGQPRQPVLPNTAKHANSDHNNIGYIGPCEARGTYTYALRVFALDTVLGLKPGTGKHDLIRAMNGHIIDAAEQTFTHYYRM